MGGMCCLEAVLFVKITTSKFIEEKKTSEVSRTETGQSNLFKNK